MYCAHTSSSIYWNSCQPEEGGGRTDDPLAFPSVGANKVMMTIRWDWHGGTLGVGLYRDKVTQQLFAQGGVAALDNDCGECWSLSSGSTRNNPHVVTLVPRSVPGVEGVAEEGMELIYGYGVVYTVWSNIFYMTSLARILTTTIPLQHIFLFPFPCCATHQSAGLFPEPEIPSYCSP